MKFVIDTLDYGHILKKLENAADFTNLQSWEEMYQSIIAAVLLIKKDIITVSKETQRKRHVYTGLSGDSPTDIYWVLSILFIMRTVGMLYSKSTDKRRTHENQVAHQQLLARFRLILEEMFERKEELNQLFSHS